jgi:hypothetical protein
VSDFIPSQIPGKEGRKKRGDFVTAFERYTTTKAKKECYLHL